MHSYKLYIQHEHGLQITIHIISVPSLHMYVRKIHIMYVLNSYALVHVDTNTTYVPVVASNIGLSHQVPIVLLVPSMWTTDPSSNHYGCRTATIIACSTSIANFPWTQLSLLSTTSELAIHTWVCLENI